MSKEINVGFDGGGMKGKIDDITASMTSMSGTTSSLIASVKRAAGVFLAFRGATFIRDQFVNATTAAIEFEDSIAQVQKVTSRFEAQQLSGSIRELATDIPIAREEITDIVEQAGRLGIEGTENIENFTESVGKLAVATNLTAEDAAKSFSRIIAVTDASVDEIENLGSVVNELSNTMATSASEITDGMLRASAAASRFGLQAESIAGFSASINEVSATARRANTRLRRLFQELQQPKKIEDVASALNMTSSEFQSMREEAPLELMEDLVSAFRSGGEAGDVLTESLGSASRQAIAGLSQNFEGLQEAVERSSEQMKENTSLQREFEIQAGTTASRIQILGNNFNNLQTRLGQTLLPTINSSTEALIDFTEWINKAKFGVTDFTRELETTVGSDALEGLKNQLTEASDGFSLFSDTTIAAGGAIASAGVGLAAFTGGLSLLASAAIAGAGGIASYVASIKEGEEETERMEQRAKSLTRAFREIDNASPKLQKKFSEQLVQLREETGKTVSELTDMAMVKKEVEEIDLSNIKAISEQSGDIIKPSDVEAIRQRIADGAELSDLPDRMLEDLGQLIKRRVQKEVNEATKEFDITDRLSKTFSKQLRTELDEIGEVTDTVISQRSDKFKSLLSDRLSDAFTISEIREVSPGERQEVFQQVVDSYAPEQLRQTTASDLSERYVKFFREEMNDVDDSVSELLDRGELLTQIQQTSMEDIADNLAKNFTEETEEKVIKRAEEQGFDEVLSGEMALSDLSPDRVKEFQTFLSELGNEADDASDSLQNLSESEVLPQDLLDQRKIQELENIRDKFQDLGSEGELFGIQGTEGGKINQVVEKLNNELDILKEKPQDFATIFNQSLEDIESEFTNTMTDMVIEGDFAFKELGKSLSRNVINKLIQQNLTSPLVSGLTGGGGGGGLGGFISQIFSTGDALITDDGKVVQFDSRDNIMAFREGGPLAQSSVGRQSSGGGNTTVNVINNTNSEVKQRRQSTRDGELIELVVGEVADNMRNGGEVAQATQGRFGVTPQPSGSF